MNTGSRYEGMIAPCGMNCGLCIGHLRDKNPCGGCFKKDDKNKPANCRSCIVVNCELLAKTESGFCYECKRYPCSRLKILDKRYRSKYHMSMHNNLQFIKKNGLDNFIINEEKKWTCKICGSGLCVHRDHCLNCKTELNEALDKKYF